MTTVTTDLRNTLESARRIRFDPANPITATDVQSAIEQASVTGVTPTGTPVTFAMSPYVPLASDTLLLVNTGGGAVTIQMPLSATRTRDLEVKDVAGGAGANPITVLRAGAEVIDGLTTYPIDAPFASARFGPTIGGYFVHA